MGIGPYRGGKSWRSRKSGPPEARLRRSSINGSPVQPDKRADVHPQGVGRIRSAPSSLTATLAIGPYNMLCNIVIGRVFRK